MSGIACARARAADGTGCQPATRIRTPTESTSDGPCVSLRLSTRGPVSGRASSLGDGLSDTDPIEPGAVELRDEALEAEQRSVGEDDSSAASEGRHRRPHAG